ncbi:NYN domain-containing protein [Leptothoe spongobia]|uniref:NYN domain-containing protein n=1 Tax=Leptothoe spongobia TAU-MAC 1115 TaxID=1967444 RepID=A0A947GK02_9CYAN|nr:NYN domain-containing protein [Leptothoe spongobia]MBT9316944.1 NYN domain-containing protein [Leptothoe spongobia TAU-MAC 1115]
MNGSPSQAILLVDGYNVIGAWPDLIELRDFQGLNAARVSLAETLANYSAYQGFETLLVFDAYGQRQSHRVEKFTQHLAIHYTSFGQTADSYIEISCAKFRDDVRKFEKRLIVATSDRAQQLTVVGYGAEWMSAAQLNADVNLSAQKVKHRQKPQKQSKQRFLSKSLNPDTQAKLARLRSNLTES